MDEKLEQALNDQIALEQASARAYRQLAVWADGHDYAGSVGWLTSQADEEDEHAAMFVQHVLDRDGAVLLQALPAPDSEFASLTDVFRAALSHEQRVTAAIGDLYALADELREYRSLPLLSRFLEEQIEEESSVRTIVAELDRVSDSPTATMFVDRELPGRRAADA
jgi:ferritin